MSYLQYHKGDPDPKKEDDDDDNYVPYVPLKHRKREEVRHSSFCVCSNWCPPFVLAVIPVGEISQSETATD